MGNAAETRTKLLETAVQLIWHRSYHQVGVNEICRRAGVTKGAFYHHFESKADLFYVAGHHFWDESKEFFDSIYSPEIPPLEQLHRLVDVILSNHGSGPFAGEQGEVIGCPVLTLGMDAGPEDAKVRLCSQELSQKAVLYLSPLVRGLKADGMLNGDQDVAKLARMMHQYMLGAMVEAQLFNTLDYMKQDLLDGMFRILDVKAEFRQTIESAAAE